MALQGADILLYPTAIGSEPQDPSINSADHWQRVMQGHAAANVSHHSFVCCHGVIFDQGLMVVLLLIDLIDDSGSGIESLWD